MPRQDIAPTQLINSMKAVRRCARRQGTRRGTVDDRSSVTVDDRSQSYHATSRQDRQQFEVLKYEQLPAQLPQDKDLDHEQSISKTSRDSHSEPTNREIVEEIQAFNEAEFSASGSPRAYRNDPTFASRDLYEIEVLKMDTKRPQIRRGESRTFHVPSESSDHMPPRAGPKISRIRIRSTFLLHLLQHITKCELGYQNGPSQSAIAQTSFVFLYPFKYFITYESEIRNSYQELKKRQGSNDTENRSRGPFVDSEKTGNEANYEDATSFKHLKLIKKLFDSYLDDVFKIRRGLRDGSIKAVRFEELWLLFEVGDYAFERKPYMDTETDLNFPSRLVRIVQFGGGRPILNNDAFKDPDRSRPSGDYLSADSKGKEAPFFIKFFSVVYDGENFGPHCESLVIPPWDGYRQVRELRLFPYKLCEQGLDFSETSLDKWKQRLVLDGHRFVGLDAISHRLYEGSSIGRIQEEYSSRVVIDYTLAYQQAEHLFPRPLLGLVTDPEIKISAPPIRPVAGIYLYKGDSREVEEDQTQGMAGADKLTSHKFQDMIHDDVQLDFSLSWFYREEGRFGHLSHITAATQKLSLLDDDLLLLPHVVPGFVLSDRKWANLDISLLKSVDQNEELWNALHIPRLYKDQLLATVDSFKVSNIEKQSNLDLVRKKGAGAIILLHGEPGVGKTFTVEAIAAYSKRPLYPITCEDLGSEIGEISGNLQQILHRGQRWGCVLLLEEADLYFGKRDQGDNILRNSIVTVFLRQLEYYPGIIFLTTNRMLKLDKAIISRITLPLHYKALSKQDGQGILDFFLRRLPKNDGQDPVLTVYYDEILKWWSNEFSEEDWWNGRTIRDLVRRAAEKARYNARHENSIPRSKNLCDLDFKSVASSYKEFLETQARD